MKMNEKHLEQLRALFPDVPDDLLDYPSFSFSAFDKYFGMRCKNGDYELYDWGTSVCFARSKYFKSFLKKIKQVRDKMEKEKFKKELATNVLCTMLNEHGFATEVFKKQDRLGINAIQPYPLVGLMQVMIEPDHIQVYYMYRTIYDKKGSPQNLINEAVEKIVEISKKEMDELTSNQ
jgi:hypothetical protein